MEFPDWVQVKTQQQKTNTIRLRCLEYIKGIFNANAVSQLQTW